MKTGTILLPPTTTVKIATPMDEQNTDEGLSGHVERTNDRDYEVEERYGFLTPNLGGFFGLSSA